MNSLLGWYDNENHRNKYVSYLVQRELDFICNFCFWVYVIVTINSYIN